MVFLSEGGRYVNHVDYKKYAREIKVTLTAMKASTSEAKPCYHIHVIEIKVTIYFPAELGSKKLINFLEIQYVVGLNFRS